MIRDLIELWALGALLLALGFAGAIQCEGPEDAAAARELEKNWRWHATMIAACTFWPVAIVVVVWWGLVGKGRQGSS